MNLRTLWQSLHVRRWHTNAELGHTHDTTTAHSARLAVLALRLWPGDDALAVACIKHDLGEAASGDVPWLAKRQPPDLAAASATAEEEWLRAAKLGDLPDDWRVKLLDRIDAYLWCQLHRPDLMERADWIEARQDIWRMCVDDADLQREVLSLICGTEKRA